MCRSCDIEDMLGTSDSQCRCAVENMQLTEKLGRLQENGGGDDSAQLHADIALLRSEILRLTDENKRLQSTPKVNSPSLSCHPSFKDCM